MKCFNIPSPIVIFVIVVPPSDCVRALTYNYYLVATMTLNDVDHVRLDNYNQQLNDGKKKTEFRSTELANHLISLFVHLKER